jgi:hypothetical protein
MVAANAPTFLATIIGASYADRFDRRRLMIATDLVRMAVVALVAVLLASVCSTCRCSWPAPR